MGDVKNRFVSLTRFFGDHQNGCGWPILRRFDTVVKARPLRSRESKQPAGERRNGSDCDDRCGNATLMSPQSLPTPARTTFRKCFTLKRGRVSLAGKTGSSDVHIHQLSCRIATTAVPKSVVSLASGGRSAAGVAGDSDETFPLCSAEHRIHSMTENSSQFSQHLSPRPRRLPERSLPTRPEFFGRSIPQSTICKAIALRFSPMNGHNVCRHNC